MIRIEINQQFKKALDLMENTNKSIFITGKAGTGKSTLLDYFKDNTQKEIIVLAPTGVAAVNINGETIHSFFGFKPDITLEKAKETAKKSKQRKANLFKSLEIIVIDEISMARADLMDCIDAFLKIILKNKKPFGGIQMVFVGDLYQLPPIVEREDKKAFAKNYPSPYFFDAQVMKDFNFEFIELEKIYRQSNQGFIDLLNGIRNRSINDKQIEILNNNVKPNCARLLNEGYIYLTTVNKAADEINGKNLNSLASKKYIFNGIIEGKFNEKFLPTKTKLEIKKDAQVMLLNNDKRGRWINGTIGKIVKVRDDDINVKLANGKKVWVAPYSWEIYKTYYNSKTNSLDKQILGSFTQFPLRLAWAITIHKSQGKTFDKAIIDLARGVFAYGQTYVALSRCTDLKGIVLKSPIKKSHIFMDWRVVKFLTKYQYGLAEKNCSLQDKIEIIEKAIKLGKKLKITYLKSNDEKSQRIILPLKIDQMEYMNVEYTGLEAFCFKRGQERIFRIDRILEIENIREA